MATMTPSPDQSHAASPDAVACSQTTAKPQRVLACLLCQQRKIKCDRKFPCGNCNKASAQCVPAALTPRQRRRRFPERELLERLRRYESLLRENSINFEPLNSSTGGHSSCRQDGKDPGLPGRMKSELPILGDRLGKDQATVKSEPVYEAKNFWDAMNQKSRSPEDADDDDEEDDGDGNDTVDSGSSCDIVRQDVVKNAIERFYESNDHFLLGSRMAHINLSTLHPAQVQIFRLWQIYVENVDPVFKITHTSTLQARFIDAACNVEDISSTTGALMFSVYCVSILSLDDSQCHALFGSSKRDLMGSFQFGCQQALMDCGVLRSDDRDTLTALFLYLISMGPTTNPKSLSPMVGVAVRIAQRMHLDNESNNSKFNVVDAELRRRLWWSLVAFDGRICEMSDCKVGALTPTWDCKIPLNVNDFDLQPDMKTAPLVHEKPTEAVFAVVRSELDEFIRHSEYYLDFTCPALKAIVKSRQPSTVPDSGRLTALEEKIGEKYLRFCNPENPLHLLTIVWTRGFIARHRLLQHWSIHSRSFEQLTDAQRDTALSYALCMLECDTKLKTSPLVKGLSWITDFYFPFPAFVHIIQDLNRRPNGKQAGKAWIVLSDAYEARFALKERDDNPFIIIFSKILLHAWEAREAVLREQGMPLELPEIVSKVRHRVAMLSSNCRNSNLGEVSGAASTNSDNCSMPTPSDSSSFGMPYSTGGQDSAYSSLSGYNNLFGQATMDVDMSQLDWTALDWWNPMHAGG